MNAFVCLVLALACGACSRRGQEQRALPSGGAAASVSAPAPAQDPDRLPAKPLPPPATPALPPQLVACGERNFYRITQGALQVFEIALQLPSPQIRGSRVARQTAEVAVAEPQNVLALPKTGALVIAKGGVVRYELVHARAQSYAPLAATAPLVAWLDARQSDTLHVRALGERSVAEYALAKLPRGDAGSRAVAAPLVPRVEQLPEFDARLFAVLADGTPLYSTRDGLRRRGATEKLAFPRLSSPPALLFADPAPERFWAADAAGRLELWSAKAAAPDLTASVPGAVLDVASEGGRLAVLSVELVDRSYRPSVTIFTNGHEQARLALGPSMGTRGQPELDVCLVAGHPWVVVGGRKWQQLLDWSSRRLLAEW